MRDACQLEIERTRSPVSAELTLLLANFTVQWDATCELVERRCDNYRPPNFTLPPVEENWRPFLPRFRQDELEAALNRRDWCNTLGTVAGSTVVAGMVFCILVFL